VGFAPTDGGTQSATLVIPSNDPDQPTVTVTLSGTGRGPEIAAAPLALEFGSVQINTRSASQTVTVQNLGTRALAIGTITLGGAHADQFRKPALTDLCSGRTLASTQSCTVGVRFRPGTPGATSAKLVIPSNDFNEDPLKVTLRGSGRP
jgi:urease beta subunit